MSTYIIFNFLTIGYLLYRIDTKAKERDLKLADSILSVIQVLKKQNTEMATQLLNKIN
jgi:hypothetical protein